MKVKYILLIFSILIVFFNMIACSKKVTSYYKLSSKECNSFTFVKRTERKNKIIDSCFFYRNISSPVHEYTKLYKIKNGNWCYYDTNKNDYFLWFDWKNFVVNDTLTFSENSKIEGVWQSAIKAVAIRNELYDGRTTYVYKIIVPNETYATEYHFDPKVGVVKIRQKSSFSKCEEYFLQKITNLKKQESGVPPRE